MKHTTHIRFDMEDEIDLSSELVEINQNFYTRRVSVTRNSLRFPIPKAIVLNLNLKATDPCFFYQTLEGTYLNFKKAPIGVSEKTIRKRNLTKAGDYDTLYLIIPPMFKNEYPETIKGIKLIQTKGLQAHEWHIQFLFTDFT